MNSKIPKTLVIGWDGAPYNKIREWIDKRDLKVLSSLVNKGSFGPLKTTPLTISSCAWTTMVTGKNAGKHGIYDFFGNDFVNDSYFRMPINSKARKSKALWHYLSEYGIKIGVVNVPMTYPVEKINGFMIGGMMSPSVNSPGFTYPPDLLKDYPYLKDYRIDIERAKHMDRKKFIQEIFKTMEERTRLFKYLMKKIKVDVFFGVYTCPDRFSHYLWHFFDENHPHRKMEPQSEIDKYKDSLLEVYRVLDDYLGELIDYFGAENVVVLSDHGFESIYKYFEFNKWLERKGYLEFKPKDKWDKFTHEKLNPKRIYIYGKVNWRRTLAYMIGKRGTVYINLEGREPQGIVKKEEYYDLVKDLIKDIKTIVDPDTNKKIVKDVLPRDKIFFGPYVDLAPDIITFFEDYYASIGYIVDLDSEELFIENSNPELELEMGIERGSGIVIFSGDYYIKSNIEGASLEDITPTLLYQYGIRIPQDMDGKILKVLDTSKINFLKPKVNVLLTDKERKVISQLKKNI